MRAFPARTFFPALATLLAAAACAQSPGSGMVSVELTRVTDSIAQQLGFDEARLPMSILVPVNVAAEACGVPATTLQPQAAKGGEGCVARTSTPQLAQVIRSRVRTDEASGAPPSTPASTPASGPRR